MVDKNRQEYADFYDELRFASSDQIRHATQTRKDILDALKGIVQWGFNHSKLDCTNISTGCNLCGEGYWSCLFINGICNASCFYCPTGQNEESVPTTNTIEFPMVEDYIDYIRKFGFKGVSISGGEPFLTFEKTLKYISAVRKAFGTAIYTWMYTNGILVSREKLLQLKAAGLNEIRFDLSAVGYKTDAVKKAVGIIDQVTVEIPAIPEDYEKLTALIKDLKSLGVNYLNLHQIRCTPHNYKKLVKRGYTFIHGPKIVVLESELTALRLIQYNSQQKINFPINYCSFIYKYRYQNRAARIRYAREICNSWEEITQTGLIRSLVIKESPEKIQGIVEHLKQKKVDEKLWQTNYHNDMLIFHCSLWDLVIKEKETVEVNYYSTALRQAISYRFPFKEIKLNTNKKIFIEKGLTHQQLLDDPVKQEIFKHLFLQSFSGGLSKEKLQAEILQWKIEKDVSGQKELIQLFTGIFDYELLDDGLYPYY
ncbi:MAG: radical SAM protein [Bacteroidales bacterium]|nr:radical SAM protein [Bacteroidales bacterium]